MGKCENTVFFSFVFFIYYYYFNDFSSKIVRLTVKNAMNRFRKIIKEKANVRYSLFQVEDNHLVSEVILILESTDCRSGVCLTLLFSPIHSFSSF